LIFYFKFSHIKINKNAHYMKQSTENNPNRLHNPVLRMLPLEEDPELDDPEELGEPEE
jgi:hypothetical protein